MYQRLNDEHYYRKFYFQDSFYAQCMDVDPLTMEQFDRSVAGVKAIIDQPIFKTAKHVIGTGCGDSNIAAFAIKEAFAYYLPDVEYEGVEAIELGRHYPYEADMPDSLALFISVSGRIYRTIEALLQCKRHGITTVAVTDSPQSETARNADILYYENSPKGDNNAGLRTYYVNVITTIILAAAMAEVRTGKSYLAELREEVRKYHEVFFAEISNIDKICFETAIHWIDKKYLGITADGPLFWTTKFIQAKIVELSGDACAVIDSENFMHVNILMGPGEEYGEIVLINSNDANVSRIADTVNNMVRRGHREVLVFADKKPEELGITETVRYCYVPMPRKEFTFLEQIYAYLPGAIFAGFRHTTIGEPMFRGGMDPTIFVPTYFSPIDVVDLDKKVEADD
ncbi:SIS domain-containing protein [Parablautia sp. Marseille-Q6255]|uniref:SIS domain-containing protein n=1 Tax=Parablautia sp. Marseille-Q6255 TaxID=3039593 RepID=UPI0024BC9B68|nr:SIS domain-containing protein [Parablautia sp. Marseille-Q6255]